MSRHNLLLAALAASILTSCQSGHQTFYSQLAPTKYPATQHVDIFDYGSSDISLIYKLLFDEHLIIGRSDFNGPYESPRHAATFAKSIGADILVTGAKFKETRHSTMTLSRPTTSTSYVSGNTFSGTITTYGTETTTVPISVDRYDQTGLFLKNVNNRRLIWRATEADFPKTSDGGAMSGHWFDENYRLRVYRSKNSIVGVIDSASGARKAWLPGQVKFVVFSEKSGTGYGFYIQGDRTPVPAKFTLNRFGHLEAQMLTSSQTFSFARAQ